MITYQIMGEFLILCNLIKAADLRILATGEFVKQSPVFEESSGIIKFILPAATIKMLYHLHLRHVLTLFHLT